MIAFVPFIRVTHSGVYTDGRPNTAAILISDVNVGFEQQNRKDPAYVPAGGSIDIPYTSWGAFSFEQGDIFKFQMAGLVTAVLVVMAGESADNVVRALAGNTRSMTFAVRFKIFPRA